MESAKAKWAAKVKPAGNASAAPAPQGFGRRERSQLDDPKKRIIAPRKESRVTALKALMMKVSALLHSHGKSPPAPRKRG